MNNTPHQDQCWRIAIDAGGTFTDAIAIDPHGDTHAAKVLSRGSLRATVHAVDGPRITLRRNWPAFPGLLTGLTLHALARTDTPLLIDDDPHGTTIHLRPAHTPHHLRPDDVVEIRTPEPAPVLAARLITRTPRHQPLPPMEIRLATTRATNTLLQRAGSPTAFFVTRGFADLLTIGNQQRPDLFSLRIQRPPPLASHVVEVHERVDTRGAVITPLDTDRLRHDARAALDAGARCAAITLLHADRHPAHERAAADVLRRAGFDHIRLSSEIAPEIGLLRRAQTTVVDAYLADAIDDYLERVAASAPHSRLLVMTSTGSLVNTDSFKPKDSLLSGPAGGVIGALEAARLTGVDHIIGLDMGGTSTDVARADGEVGYTFEHTVGDATLVSPAVRIETVAAGGGSICACRPDGLAVGPDSAGADPGPACYGAGGPLTLTDVNLLLGRLHPRHFRIPIDPAPARAALRALLQPARATLDPKLTEQELLRALLAIANERMANAIRNISTRDGVDPAGYALVAFGGAGPQHACAVADRLAITSVIVPLDAGVLSATGVGVARIERFAQRQILAAHPPDADRQPPEFAELELEARAAVQREGVPANEISISRRIASVRLAGQDHTIDVDTTDKTPIAHAFRERFLALFGYQPPARDLEIVALRVVASSPPDRWPARQPQPDTSPTPQHAHDQLDAWFDGPVRAPAHSRSNLTPADRIDGPAIVLDPHCTVVVEPGWHADVHASGSLMLARDTDHPHVRQHAGEAIETELLVNRLTAIAEEMGEAVRRTSVSTNVKDRLDYSCAILDADAGLLVNAPHVPVHLGSLGVCVDAVRNHTELHPLDVVATNHPAFGGSHLPDITVIAPIHTNAGEIIAYAAVRAHHAEIGGTAPGSFPPGATTLAEEGAVIPPTHIIRAGRDTFEEITELLTGGPHPTRALDDNLADLRAAVAAVFTARRAIGTLVDEHSAPTLRARMLAIRNRAERAMRNALARRPDGTTEAEERLDNGAPIRVRIDITSDSATFDFTGSAPVDHGNLNATPAIVRSAVVYVLRLLVDEPVPLNDGLLDPVRIILPEGMLNPPFSPDPTRCPPVAGGNVETSQRLVDTLLKALSLAACSQGTMNSLVFGDDRRSYYETICGGTGAGPDFDGASGVHTHMTNTRITDPEILELRFPVRLERFALRPGSGGNGAHRGGDGVTRELTFLEPLHVALVTQHRVEQPYGLAGGLPGERGRQRLITPDGNETTLAPIDAFNARPGDRLIIDTPAGGGFGPPPAQ